MFFIFYIGRTLSVTDNVLNSIYSYLYSYREGKDKHINGCPVQETEIGVWERGRERSFSLSAFPSILVILLLKYGNMVCIYSNYIQEIKCLKK